MIYKDISIPYNFSNIAEISDNYIVFVKENKLFNGIDYEAYYQFINPSTYILYTDNYRITKGDYYNYEANYTNVGGFSYITDYDTNYTLNTLQVDDDFISSFDKDRADIIYIFLGQILCCVVILWIFKQLSRLFSKGGLC